MTAVRQRDMREPKFAVYGRATTIEGRRATVTEARKDAYDASARKMQEAARRTR